MSVTTSALLAAWIVLALFGLALAGLVRQVHALARGRGLRGLAAGGPTLRSAAPSLNADGYPEDGPTLIIFVDRECGSCKLVLGELATLLDGGAFARTALSVVSAGPAHHVNHEKPVIYADSPDLLSAFSVPATPFAVVVDEDGRIESAAPLGSAAALRALVPALDSRRSVFA